MNFYVLAYAHWEDYVPYFFISEQLLSKEEFESVCLDLVPQAGLNSLKAHEGQDYDSFIGWNEVVEAMIPLLEEKGFKHVKPTRAVFSGSGIIDLNDSKGLGSSTEAILAHNAKIYQQMNDEPYDP